MKNEETTGSWKPMKQKQGGRNGKDLEVTEINDTKGSGGVVNTCKVSFEEEGASTGIANAEYDHKQK